MTPAEQSLLSAIEGAPPAPAIWLGALRRRAAQRFTLQGLPTAKMEEWRHTSLSRLAPLAFAAPSARSGETPAELGRLGEYTGRHRLVFVNGRFREELSRRGSLPVGVFAGSLQRALVERPGLVEPHLGGVAAVEGNSFAALNTALLQDGALVYVPDGVVLSEEIELLFVTGGGETPKVVHPRTLLVAGAGARATVVEDYRGICAGPNLTAAVTEVVLGDGAHIDHYKIQEEPEGSFHVGVLASRQAKGSHFSTHQTSLGALLSRSEVWAVLDGEGAEARVNGLYMAEGEQLVDNHSLIEHARPRCLSRETYKGILDGRARGVFGGRIRVLEGAQKSDAYQVNSNLLLSEGAEADAKPQLEIFADDVKCGHGGTVGQLDEEALFYLRSRGIPRLAARSMLTYAFASEMVEMVRPQGLKARLGRLVSMRLADGERLREAA